jgi:RimJ/RimL family protein N-acetyltransferase
VYDFNTPAIRLYERLGFVKEGLIRESRRMNGGYWSHFHMSILEDEWRSGQA